MTSVSRAAPSPWCPQVRGLLGFQRGSWHSWAGGWEVPRARKGIGKQACLPWPYLPPSQDSCPRDPPSTFVLAASLTCLTAITSGMLGWTVWTR